MTTIDDLELVVPVVVATAAVISHTSGFGISRTAFTHDIVVIARIRETRYQQARLRLNYKYKRQIKMIRRD